ncbi:MAG: hypothetical protein UY78_C0048G0006 [Parcubacteria group bacterium GW2011_GWA1_53_13]|nr:MAG: hypothetical protein UY78_C0048G0006 [Parcubacteria group bacterium GW2011_GWA1_53_13]
MKICGLCGAGHTEDQCPNCYPTISVITPVGGGNETVLHLPDSSDFEILHDKDLEDPKQRPRLLKLMLEPGNFGRAFPYWVAIAKGLGIADIRNNATTRAFLRARLGLGEPATA